MPAPSGSQYVLHDSSSNATAVVTEVGAMLRVFEVAGRDVVVPFPEDAIAPAGHGAILAPWPNRLRDGHYTFEGQDYQLPVTEVARGTALHGLAMWQRWSLLDSTTNQVVLGLDTIPVGGYPWQLELVAAYALEGTTLTIEVDATNVSDTTAPYGVGFHPWLSPGPGSLDDATLRLDAAGWVTTDDRLLPTGVVPIPEKFDFRVERVLGDTDLDDAFVDVVRDEDGLAWIRLTGTDGRTAAVWMDDSMDTFQVCSGDHIGAVDYRRAGLAAEPMSCVADAFNSGDRLVSLAPGETASVRWGISLL
ncbi:aldose 1-epimerase [Salana multivorans]|uniref:Aldose 1-epimerase n=1 Tax=Salana multivorans TaxID=120377 RepID=A0A3N2D7N8_9MICO|nr:aldose 1-epimerase family protein [Salana multivorans]ROR95678.1 aldose 1-epimerase [Salana multivorans]